jgi:transcription antitermination factor NusA-like protein
MVWMMMISKRKFRIVDRCNPYVMQVKCTRSSKIGEILQQLGGRNFINQLFMVELIERATTTKNIDTFHT